MSRICVPLGLQDTRITLNASMRDRLAQGHDKSLRPTSNWDLAALAGAGALRSTANDLLKFMRATCLSDTDAPLRSAIDLLLQTRRAVRFPDLEQALGWFVRSGDDDQMIYHPGRTGGYASHIGFSTRLRSGAIILSNTADPLGMVRQAAFPLMNPAYKGVAEVQFPPQVPVNAAVLASYEGAYRVTPTFALTIRAESGKLFVRGTGQAEYQLFAESERSFFMYFSDAQAVFVRNADGKVDQMLWQQARKPYSCVRVA